MIDAMTGARERLRSPAVLLNLVGVVLVGSAVLPTHDGSAVVAVIALGAVSLVAWTGWAVGARGRLRDVAIPVGVLAAAAGAGLGAPSLLAPAIAGLLVAIADTAHGVRPLVALVGVAVAVLAVAAIVHGQTLGELLSSLAGLAVGALGGVARRQRRIAAGRERELLERSLAAEREGRRIELLEARGAAARDVHDVLAHSLGGLVLQLDAIEALLEHGRVEEAATRATAARRLAGEGLTEARRAVAALRDPSAAAPPAAVPDDALEVLVAEHGALGSRAESTGDPSLRGLDAPHRAALAAALREALVNARRHAPGALVAVRFDRPAHAMVVQVSNGLPSAPATPSPGGHGLAGMRERFAALADGSGVTASAEGDRFVVTATAVTT